MGTSCSRDQAIAALNVASQPEMDLFVARLRPVTKSKLRRLICPESGSPGHVSDLHSSDLAGLEYLEAQRRSQRDSFRENAIKSGQQELHEAESKLRQLLEANFEVKQEGGVMVSLQAFVEQAISTLLRDAVVSVVSDALFKACSGAGISRRRRASNSALHSIGGGPNSSSGSSKFYAMDELSCPNIDPNVIGQELREVAKRRGPVSPDVMYWAGSPQPWRYGSNNEPISDAALISKEESRKDMAERDDETASPTTERHADLLWSCGVSVEFLLLLTFELDLWDWKTWEIVRFLVKPMTQATRCRFAHLQSIERRFFGRATVFMSHCWGGRWGDLVGAACAGANSSRFVWIDAFAVTNPSCETMLVFPTPQ